MISYPDTILQHIVEQVKHIIKSDADEHTKYEQIKSTVEEQLKFYEPQKRAEQEEIERISLQRKDV